MEIWLSDADGGNLVQVTHFDGGHSGTRRWSPDGSKISFDRQLKDGWRIYVMASDGSQIRRLTQYDGDEFDPSWSRDGKWIYYDCNGTGQSQIWKAPAQGGEGSQVTRNGGWIAFESSDGRSLYYINAGRLLAIPLKGGPETTVLESVWARSYAVTDEGIYYIPRPGAGEGMSLRFHNYATGKSVQVAPISEEVAEGLTVSQDRKSILVPVFARSGTNVMVVDNFR